ncbi:MAG: hypothetical protein AAGI17_06320 [Planctomycetota bacterium]
MQGSERSRLPWIRIALGLIAASIGIVGVLLWRWVYVTPKPRTNYLAELHRQVDTAPESSTPTAIDRYIDVWLELPYDEIPLDEITAAASGEDLDRVEQYLAEHHDDIRSLIEVASIPHLGFVPQAGVPDVWKRFRFGGAQRAEKNELETSGPPFLLDVILPHLGPMRVSARLLAADVRLAARRGDAARVQQGLIAMCNIAVHGSGTRLVISDLLGSAVLVLASATALDVLSEDPQAIGTPDEAALVVDAFIRAARKLGGSAPINADRLTYLDVAQRVFRSNGKGGVSPAGLRWFDSQTGGSADIDGLSGVGTSILVSVMSASGDRDTEFAETYFDAGKQLMKAPLWEWESRGTLDTYYRLAGELDASNFLAAKIVLPAFDRYAGMTHLANAQANAAAMLIKLHAEQNAGIPMPTTIEPAEWISRGVDVRDPFSGTPFKYRIKNGRPLVYSVGNDFIDNRGESIEANIPQPTLIGTELPDDLKGDWVLFPPPDRPQDDN